MAVTWIKLKDSFLSPEVRQLLQRSTPELSQEKEITDHSWILWQDGILWKKLENIFSSSKNEYASKAWFHDILQQLMPMFGECYHLLQHIYPSPYSESLRLFLEWTHQEKEIDRCIQQILQGSDSSDHLVALLTITALVERALGNILMGKCKQIPFLLRDLLATPELEEMLGKPKVQLLTVMLGSVLGLNLRNIAWHGFLNPHETSPSFVATIIFVLVDCGRILQKKIKNIQYRPQISFEEAVSLCSTFKEIVLPERPILEEIIRNSSLVPVVMYPAWMKVLDLLFRRQWGLCITLLLPLLESSMRGIYAHANKASERILTAENSTLYTTMDEILNEYVDSDLKQRNQVQYAIGTKVNEALHDLLNFIHGPRVRDKVSHGEAQLHEMPQDLAFHILYLSLLVLSSDCKDLDDESLICSNNIKAAEDLLENCPDVGTSVKQSQNCYPVTETCNFMNNEYSYLHDLSGSSQEFMGSLRTCMNIYSCVYHPSSLLQGKLIHTVSHLSNWINWDRVKGEELDYQEWESWDKIQLPEIISCLPMQSSHTVCKLCDIQVFLGLVKNIQYKVLYRPKQEIELVSMLQRIVASISVALEMTCENLTRKYSQYTNKKLRSRQRETYKRQLTGVPAVVLNCFLSSQVVYLIFMNINKSSSMSQSSFSTLMRHLKPILKVMENLVSQTSLSVNRWDEAVGSSISNIDHIKQFF